MAHWLIIACTCVLLGQHRVCVCVCFKLELVDIIKKSGESCNVK